MSEMFIGDPVIALVVGTRPEAVKIAPVVQALRKLGMAPKVIDTGQQPGRVAETLAPFDVPVDGTLAVERRVGTLNELLALAVTGVDGYLVAARPAAVLVQGDTTTALAVGLASTMLSIPLVHLEAGLRTGDRQQPFPEETNRVLLADLAALHLAPTPRAAGALLAEGVRGATIVVTGNTVVDALTSRLPSISSRPLPAGVTASRGRRLLVVTVHRRESWGKGVRAVAESVRQLLLDQPHLHAVVVTHPNPAVRDEIRAILSDIPRCDLLCPLPYDDMLTLLVHANVVLTDSGGIQEEAPTLRVPVVVTRAVTERPEGVEAGWADLVGTDPQAIRAAVSRRLAEPGLPPASENPYGDGRAAPRVARSIASLLGRADRPIDWMPNSASIRHSVVL